jgi:hypothetical protein
MNYRNIITDKLDEFKKDLPDYSFTQCIFAAIRHLDCFKTFDKSDLLSITDEDMYTALEAALKVETNKSVKYEH